MSQVAVPLERDEQEPERLTEGGAQSSEQRTEDGRLLVDMHEKIHHKRRPLSEEDVRRYDAIMNSDRREGLTSSELRMAEGLRTHVEIARRLLATE